MRLKTSSYNKYNVLKGEVLQPLVSVIVPVFKVEDCLERCLNSLSKQSFTAIEIILVDDASPDRCGEICDGYATRDQRFRVFHLAQNQGLAEARNTGIREASCEYLMFVDSDDYVHEDFCKDAYECAVRYRADIVMFERQRCDQDGHLLETTRKSVCTNNEGYKTKQEALDLLHGRVGNFAWNKLYRKELFRTIVYPKGYFYEDYGTTYKLILKASVIYYVDKVLYYWCFHPDSITTLRTKKAFQDRYNMMKNQYYDLVKLGYCPLVKAEMILLGSSLDYCINQKTDTSDHIYNSCAKRIRESDLIPQNFHWKRKVLLYLFRYYPVLFELICTFYGKKI